MGKGAGKKITKIIGLGKKKPSTDEQTSSAEEDVPTCGKTKYPHNVIQPDLKVKVCVHVLNESKERSKYQRLCNLFPKAVFLDSSKSRRGELYKGG